MLQNTDSVRVTVSHSFTAPPERVFDAWLDPETVARFLFKTPTGIMKRVSLDVRIGGSYEIVERRGELDAVHHGKYLEIRRPHCLVFTMDDAGFASTTVTLVLVPENSGCKLMLTHEGVSPAYELQTRAGWTGILSGLSELVS